MQRLKPHIEIAVQRTASALAMLAILMSAVSSDFTGMGVAGASAAFVATGIAWWFGERQYVENRKLLAHVDLLAKRTPTEHGTSAAFSGQGELATWNYSDLVKRLREDGLVS